MSKTSFGNVFIAVVIGGALILAALIVNHQRPDVHTAQPDEDFVRATGKCAQCHLRETSAVVHQFEMSAHHEAQLTCYDCHHAVPGQQQEEHNGFTIATEVTSLNCRQCHVTEYEQFVRSRHGAPAWAAVTGPQDFTPEQIAFAEKHHPGTVERPPNALAQLEGMGTTVKGCQTCHGIGKPNADGSIGSCTHCHSRHSTSISLAREPRTCGQCHMGPDHSQLEIYNESKHGALFNAQKAHMNLDADPKNLTTRDFPVPVCATCHMSGLEGMKVTHDVGERLSYYLFADVTEKRPNFESGRREMQEVCTKCHSLPHVEKFYEEADQVVVDTNERVGQAKALMAELRAEGLLGEQDFDQPIEYLYFDLWHYYGRTAKHGAFMGGADFVQWHGTYEVVHYLTKLKAEATELRAEAAEVDHAPSP